MQFDPAVKLISKKQGKAYQQLHRDNQLALF